MKGTKAKRKRLLKLGALVAALGAGVWVWIALRRREAELEALAAEATFRRARPALRRAQRIT